MRRWLSAGLAGPVLSLIVVGVCTAVAAEPGVHVDPDSPAGKEYALPLDTARRAAEGGARGTGNDATPLFGAGISNRNGGDPNGGGGATAEGVSDRGAPSSEQGDATPDRQDRAGASGAGNRARDRVVSDSGDGPSPGLVTLLIALAVLAVGGVIGLSVRAMRGPHTTG